MSDTVYQIVGECAYVTVETPVGKKRTLLYKGSLVPANAPELKHLLSSGLVKKVGGEETGGVNADGKAAGELTGEGQQPTPASTPNPDPNPTPEAGAGDEVAARRKAAQEKLAALAGPPDGRASKDVLVEYLVQQGGNYDDLVKAEKPDLVEMVKSRQS